MNTSALQQMTQGRRLRLVLQGLARSLGICAVLIALYYLAPMDHLNSVPLWIPLSGGVVALTVVGVHQLRAVFKADYPGIRAAEALATTVPLFLLLFAASYFVIAQDSGVNFNVHALTRTDSLYFTVTVFSTVGFGDITATSQTARLMVTVQMILDLVVLGLVVRAFVGAVQSARQERLVDGGPRENP